MKSGNPILRAGLPLTQCIDHVPEPDNAVDLPRLHQERLNITRQTPEVGSPETIAKHSPDPSKKSDVEEIASLPTSSLQNGRDPA